MLKIYIVQALYAIDVAAVPELIKVLDDKDIGMDAQIILANMGKSALGRLIEVLLDKKSQKRLLAVSVLSDMGKNAASAIPALTQVLEGANSELKKAITLALKRIKE